MKILKLALVWLMICYIVFLIGIFFILWFGLSLVTAIFLGGGPGGLTVLFCGIGFLVAFYINIQCWPKFKVGFSELRSGNEE